jgi:Lipase (class 3)
MSTQTSSPDQITMTLAALAGTSSAAAPGPSPESAEAHIARIQTGIAGYLADTSLATGGNWTVVWVGMYPQKKPNDNNLAYIATGPSGELAVVIRGTTNDYETKEDEDCGEQVDCRQILRDGKVSKGMRQAFENIVEMGLVAALKKQVSGTTTTIYVTGHSLGGALATMVALYLKGQRWDDAKPTLALYTFAAPTAGDAAFAAAVNALSPAPMCYVNAYDVVPLGYADLSQVSTLYTDVPYQGTAYTIKPTRLEQDAINHLIHKVGSLVYVQPTQQSPLNPTPTRFDVTSSYVDEVAYQHANDNYLTLLGGTPVPNDTPVVTAVSADGTTVTITVEASSTSVDVAIGTGSTKKPEYVAVTGAQYATPPTNPPTIVCQTATALAGAFNAWVTTEYGTSAPYASTG